MRHARISAIVFSRSRSRHRSGSICSSSSRADDTRRQQIGRRRQQRPGPRPGVGVGGGGGGRDDDAAPATLSRPPPSSSTTAPLAVGTPPANALGAPSSAAARQRPTSPPRAAAADGAGGGVAVDVVTVPAPPPVVSSPPSSSDAKERQPHVAAFARFAGAIARVWRRRRRGATPPGVLAVGGVAVRLVAGNPRSRSEPSARRHARLHGARGAPAQRLRPECDWYPSAASYTRCSWVTHPSTPIRRRRPPRRSCATTRRSPSHRRRRICPPGRRPHPIALVRRERRPTLAQIKAHPFFAGVEWEGLRGQRCSSRRASSPRSTRRTLTNSSPPPPAASRRRPPGGRSRPAAAGMGSRAGAPQTAERPRSESNILFAGREYRRPRHSEGAPWRVRLSAQDECVPRGA